jgi:hypothetical protein
MGDFFLGSIDLLIGLGLVFGGLRVFFAVLPIGAFFVGGYVGGVAVFHLFDRPFLATFSSVLAGVAVGLALALVSILLWYVGALIMAGSVGAPLGSGLMAAFNVDSDWAIAIVALCGAALAVIIAYVLNLPAIIVLVSTSLAGSSLAVLGAMLVLNRVDVEDLEVGPALAAVNQSWFWALAGAVLAGAGIWVQYMMSREIELPEGRWARLQPERYARIGPAA